jgi:hypothetical protein
MRPAIVPAALRYARFRGRDAVASGLVTRRQLGGQVWRANSSATYTCAPTCSWITKRGAARRLLLLPPGAALSHRSAGFLFGADVLPLEAPVDMTVPTSCRIRPRPRLRVFRTHLTAEFLCRRAGLTVTKPLRTAWDLARGPELVEAVVGVDALLYRRLIRHDALLHFIEDHDGRPGFCRARRVLGLAMPGAESPMETRWTILRFTADDVLRHPERVVGQVRLALAEAARRS